MVNAEYGDLKTKVFFVWGATCTACVLFAWWCVPETKGLSLEQVDAMLEECTARKSRAWVPHALFKEQVEVGSMEGEKSEIHVREEYREHREA